jgi:NAD(P)H dehydrogenase (quinone)
MDHDEIAEAMSEVLEAKITYQPIEIAEFRRRMEQTYKFNPFLVQHLTEVAQDYQDGIVAGTSNAVEEITGKRAMTVQEFIKAHRQAFV